MSTLRSHADPPGHVCEYPVSTREYPFREYPVSTRHCAGGVRSLANLAASEGKCT